MPPLQAVSFVGRTVLRSEDVDVAKISGVEPDHPGGLSALLVGVLGNSLLVLLMLRYVEGLRKSNPLLHEGNMTRLKGGNNAVPWGSEAGPRDMLQQKWGWICTAMALNIDDVEAAGGLDAAMMVEFADLSMQILLVIGQARAVLKGGLPLVLILCPLHFLCGDSLDDDGLLSLIGMANVEQGSWLCWLHSAIVWFVVMVVLHSVETAQAKDQLEQAMCSLERYGERPKAFFPDSPVHKAVTADHIVLDSPVLQIERSALHAERQRLGLENAGEPDFHQGAYATSGFVTFKERRDAEIALRMQYRAHGMQPPVVFVVSSPPAPEDVRHLDLQKREWGFGDALVGYSCIVFLFWVFAPFIVAFSAVARLENLQTIVGLLPNWLTFICEWLFIMKSGRQLQLQVQKWYFYFLVVFVLMITAIGCSLFYTLKSLVERPGEIFSLLANTLPYSTHFYLSYFPFQWTVYAAEVTRYHVAVKYFALKALRGAQRAMEAICVLGFLCFFICRVSYTYLLVYSEIPKPDTGGAFWCAQLHHVQQGLFIYVLLMTGVLLDKADSLGPPLITLACGVQLLQRYMRFRRRFQWHGLPFEDLNHEPRTPKPAASNSTDAYRQPELLSSEDA
eukprot:Skav215086  [mRNA]  locus=scaffold1068:49011:57274:+ [translate_table: standard]